MATKNLIEQQIASLREKQKNLQDETNALLQGLLDMTAQTLSASCSGGDFIRPTFKVDRSNLLGKATIIIDNGLADDFESSDWSVKDSKREYRHYVTGNMTTNDAWIIPFFGISKLQSVEEILTTALYLIHQDVNEKGILHEDLENDRNVNCGYCKLEDSMYVVWVERTRTPGEYHIHKEKVPRFYKPHRHFLIPG
ncbi:MAG: hypothetical protein KBC17_03030 [Candidatus Pacebacteria bacterium]|nr:hypothetical protein [Candidatus Paceibacterota bacterium]